jgi:uncharacterized membrane protein YhaH (DUF805 family)
MVTFGTAIKLAWQKYFQFRGASSRAEYWWYRLFAYIVSVAVGLIDLALGIDNIFGDTFTLLGGPFEIAALLFFFLPDLTILVRRFRDAGVSPYWLIPGLIPISGFITWAINYWTMLGEIFRAAMSETISDAEASKLVEQWAQDPTFQQAMLQMFGIALLLGAYLVFEFVITLLPTKKPKQPVVATTDY